MERPGMMIYFDVLDALETLSMADRGQLFTAILAYGSRGTVPNFRSTALKLAWSMLQGRLDRDKESYLKVCEQREYAAFCKKRQQAGDPKLPFDLWKRMDPAARKEMYQ